MIFQTKEKDVMLVMWEKTLMPDSVRSQDEKGKTIFTKTGTKSEYTTYTFRDSFGDKLVLLSKNNDYRILEGKAVNLTLEVKRDEFKNVTKVHMAELSEIKK